MQKLFFLAGAAVAALLFTAEVRSADFYEGKTVRIIVGYSPGGGYDTYARLIARYLDKYIPGQPRLIVENRPGAGGLIAANYLYNEPRQNGTTMLHVGGSTIIKQFTGSKNVKYDVTKFKYVGAPTIEKTVLVVTKNSGFTSLDQVFQKGGKELVLGGISTGSPQDVASILLRDVLRGSVRLVTGYGGTANIRLAMEQGELDGMFNGWASLKSSNWERIQKGEWLILLQVSEQPITDLPGNIPMIFSLAKNAEDRQLIRLTTLVPYQFARPFLVGPGVPAERVAILEQAFAQTMADPQFLAEANKARLDIEPIDGAKLAASVSEFMSMSAQVKSRVTQLLVQ